MLKYQILYKGNVIAQFAHESDRDLCLCVLREEYPDSIFAVKNLD